jgi:hypothetical protein
MPPITEIGGGDWSCGARAKHHHRKRLRNPEFLALRTTTYGVASSSCRASRRQQRQHLAPRASRWRRGGAKQKALAPREGQALEERSSSSRLTRRSRTRDQQLSCVRRRQRQQLAPRASRWRRRGADQIALAPREGQALEERSSSSRSAGRPRTRDTRDVQLPCVRQRQRQQLAPRASRWRRGAALASREGQAQRGGPGKVGGDLAHQGRHERVIARGVQQPCVTTTTAAAAARQARRANEHSGHVLASVRGYVPAAQGPRAVAHPNLRGSQNERRASPRRQRRTSTSRDDDDSSRSRGAKVALEGREGSSPRTRSCDGSSSARLLACGQRARRASQ